ncbi:MAG: tetratricopeptide repeat protein [Thermoplasmatales archaeon]|nr:tetratricopeptide repeat protein [Thermoplasmatales archaeon]
MGEDEITFLTKGRFLMQAKKYGNALECFDKAIKLNPKYAEAYNEKGNALLILGKIDEAINCFTKATKINEKYITAWKGKEVALLMQNKQDEAIRCCDTITGIDPENEEAWVTKGFLLSDIHRFDEALKCFDKAVEINPESIDAYNKKAEVLLALGRFDEGEKCRQKIEEIKREVRVKKMKKLMKKICLVGDPAVGKTSLVRRYVYDMFDDKYLYTIGAKITKKVIDISYPTHDVNFTLMIWDIEGQKGIGKVHSTYYRGADATIIVCDVTMKETLENIPNWKDAVFKVTGEIPLVFLANKIDLPNKVFNEKEIKAVASEFKAPYLFTSAKTGENVENAFITVSKLLLE